MERGAKGEKGGVTRKAATATVVELPSIKGIESPLTKVECQMQGCYDCRLAGPEV